MLLEHCNHNEAICNIFYVYMADASAQTIEKPNYTLRDQYMERWRERDREFFI